MLFRVAMNEETKKALEAYSRTGPCECYSHYVVRIENGQRIEEQKPEHLLCERLQMWLKYVRIRDGAIN